MDLRTVVSAADRHYICLFLFNCHNNQTVATVWCIFTLSYESGVLEDPAHHAPSGLYQITSDPETAPDTADCINIEFKKGDIACLS